jgi:hypothetical protein
MLILNSLFHSFYGATAPSGPWLPSEDATILLPLLLVSSILVFLGSVMCPSERRPPFFFVFSPLIFCYEELLAKQLYFF